MGRGRGRHLGCVPYKVFPRHTSPTRGMGVRGGGGDSQNLRTIHTQQGPILRILHLRVQGASKADPPPAFTPTQPRAPQLQLGC
jgi:hypothetical protein